MDKNMRTPSLRFKGFTDDWEQRKLGDMGSTYTGLSGKNKEDFGHGNGKYVTYMNVFINPISDFSRVESVEIDKTQNEVMYGDVFFTTSSETPDEVGMSSVWLEISENTYLNSFCFGYRPSVNIDHYYMAYMLRSEVVRKKIIYLAQGISRYNISKNKVMEIAVPLPNLDEQKQIGTFFCNLDNLITLHQRKYDKLVNIKKSLLEKMFPQNGESIPRLRFKGFTDAWEQCKLGNLGRTQSGVGFPDVEQGGQEGIPFYKVSDMNTPGNEHEMLNANHYVTNDQIAKRAWNPIDAVPAIMFAKVGAAVMLNRKRLVSRPFLLDNNTMAYSFGAQLDTKFGKTLFDTIYLPSLVQVGALPSYNATDINELEVKVPKHDEQSKIGLVFSNIDNLITLHQRKYEKLQNIKKALLQKMFV